MELSKVIGTKLSDDSLFIVILSIPLFLFSFSIGTSHAMLTLSSTVLLISLTLSPHFKKVYSLIKQPIILCFFAFYALVALSVFYTEALPAEWHITLRKYSKLLYLPFLMYLFTFKPLRSISIGAFFISMLILLSLSFLKVLGVIALGKGPEPNTLYLDHIMTSCFFTFTAFALAHYAYQYEGWKRYISAFLCAAFVFNLLCLSQSRTSLIALTFLSILFVWQRYSLKAIGMSFLLIPLVLFMTQQLSPHFKHQMLERPIASLNAYTQDNHFDTSLGLRLIYADYALRVIKKHWQEGNWLLGSGAGSSQQEYQKVNKPFLKEATQWHDPHNQFLYNTIEFGVLGLSLFLAMLAYQWCYSIYLPELSRYFMQGVVITFIFMCLLNSYLRASAPASFFVFFTAWCFSSLPHSKQTLHRKKGL